MNSRLFHGDLLDVGGSEDFGHRGREALQSGRVHQTTRIGLWNITTRLRPPHLQRRPQPSQHRSRTRPPFAKTMGPIFTSTPAAAPTGGPIFTSTSAAAGIGGPIFTSTPAATSAAARGWCGFGPNWGAPAAAGMGGFTRSVVGRSAVAAIGPTRSEAAAIGPTCTRPVVVGGMGRSAAAGRSAGWAPAASGMGFRHWGCGWVG